MVLVVSFFATLALVYMTLQVPYIGRFGVLCARRLANLLDSRGAFHSNLAAEIPKFAVLRMIFGALLTQRAIYILIFLFPTDTYNTPLFVFALLIALAGIFVLVGFMTQIAFAYLIVYWHVSELLVGTVSLGDYLTTILAIFLMFANAGAHLSVDGVLRKSDTFVGIFIRGTYYRWGVPPWETLQVAKFIALFSYWCICVYSLMMHLADPAWTTGVAGPQLLSNNFMNRYFSEFIAIFEFSSLAIYLSRFSLWIMMLWYVSLLPFVLIGGAPRKFAIYWGVLFFILSTFFLLLGWVGEFEFILWACLFWTSAIINGQRSFALCYDDRCRLCDRTVNFLRRMDIFKRIELKPLSLHRAWLQSMGISHEEAMIDLYGIDLSANNRTYVGYDLYLHLSKILFLLIPIFPVLLLGKILGLGPRLYRWIAVRRTRFFGVCEIPTTKPEYIYLTGTEVVRNISKRDPVVAVLVHMLILGAAFLATIPAPFAGWGGAPFHASFQPVVNLAGRASLMYGIGPINVFNQTDLKMAENWFTIEAILPGAKRSLLPILAEDGSRLGWHRSDRIYFGHTLRWRRSHIGKSGCFFKDNLALMHGFARLYEHIELTTPQEYIYRQYKQAIPSSEKLIAGVFEAHTVEVVCEMRFNSETIA
jgi:predicted DCC family thiol-disulfide oxidoreductase YuxK